MEDNESNNRGNMTILSSVKTVLGIPEEDTYFDQTLILHINSVFSILCQIGCGPTAGFMITGPETWDDFLQNDPDREQLVKTYLPLRVRQIFDPPINGTVSQALANQIAELEWRISALVDPGGIPTDKSGMISGTFDNLDDNEY